MKQLSIEEKAKAYDEALKVLHKYDGANIMFSQSLKEEMFPELKESEDEKIRKAIIDIIRVGYSDYAKEFTKQELIAWLEKQGEQKPNYCHHDVDLSNCSEEYRKGYYDGWNNCNMQHSQCKLELDGVVKCLINGMKFYYEDNEEATWGTDKWSMPVKYIIEVLEKQCKNNMGISEATKQKLEDNLNKALEKETPESWNEFLEKQGEQKPTDIPKDFEKLVEHLLSLSDGEGHGSPAKVKEVSAELLKLAKPQNPAWSEEDEAKLKSILFHIEDVENKDVIDWLKSLKDRVQPNPAWGEKDRRMLIGLIDELDAIMNKATPNEISVYSKYTNWLKSLRPQNKWKPSSFHLECISDAITMYETRGINAIGLKEILEELKKLREE